VQHERQQKRRRERDEQPEHQREAEARAHRSGGARAIARADAAPDERDAADRERREQRVRRPDHGATDLHRRERVGAVVPEHAAVDEEHRGVQELLRDRGSSEGPDRAQGFVADR